MGKGEGGGWRGQGGQNFGSVGLVGNRRGFVEGGQNLGGSFGHLERRWRGPDDLNSVRGIWCEILGVLAKVISIRRELRSSGVTLL